jgi:hypothetical protein
MTVLQINSMLAKNYFVPRHISFLGQYEIYLKNAEYKVIVREFDEIH